MRKDFILYSMLGFLAGCSAEDSPVDSTAVSTIQINARNFELPSTRTLIDSQDYSVAWATGDAIGIFPEMGNQIAFSIDHETSGSHAVFNGGGWKLDGDGKYAAYYPCIDRAFQDKTAIPLDYRGQTQSENGKTNGLSQFDYLITDFVNPTAGTVSFDFRHLGALLKMSFKVPVSTIFKQLEIVCKDGMFITQQKLNLTSGDLIVTDESETVSLSLCEGISVNAGQTLTAFMMVAPKDLSAHSLTFILTDDNNVQYSFTRTGDDFAAGKVYVFEGDCASGDDHGVHVDGYGPDADYDASSGSINKNPYGKDNCWDNGSSSLDGVHASGYGKDTNYDASSGSIGSVNKNPYGNDTNWDNGSSSLSGVTASGYGADKNHDDTPDE